MGVARDAGTAGGSRATASRLRTHLRILLAGAVAAAGAALSGIAVVAAVVLVAWVTDSRTGASAGEAVRTAAAAWLLAHHGTLRLPSGTVAAVPLGLTVLPAVLLHRAGVSMARSLGVGSLGVATRGPGRADRRRTLAGRGARERLRERQRRGPSTSAETREPALATAGAAVAALAVGYSGLAVLVARLAGTPAASVGPVSAGLGAAVLAAVAGGLGVVRAGYLRAVVARLLPPAAPAVARATAAAVASLLAAGAALVALGLVGHAGRAITLTRALDPGLVGAVVLLLAGVLLAPNAVVWGAAYAAGPGFALGAGTAVSPFGSALGPVPALPLLAALPQGEATPPALRAVLVVPVAAGALAGVLLGRRLPAGTSPGWAAVAGAVTGLASGAALAVLATLAGGPVGGGYLTAVGPSPWQVGLAVAVEIGAPAALVAALLPTRRPHQPL